MGNVQKGANAISAGACLLLAGFALVFGLWGCVSGDDDDEPVGDVFGQEACTQYAVASSDYGDGVLTDEEMRAQLQEVEASASLADQPGLHDAARSVLAGFTQGTINQQEVDALTDLCTVVLAAP